MGSPTSRLLELLELLQARPVVTGREIADRLGVDTRTVRRYLTVLQELGIPVEGQRGVGGGYRLRPGYRLPPLMLGNDEAVVVVLGLLAARRLGLDTASEAAEGALEKIHRVLPADLRRQVEALERTLGFTAGPISGAPVPGETVLMLADAVRRGRRVRASYRAYAGETSRRDLSPFGLVVHAGRWYLAAHDHGREALRTFRIDRMTRVLVGDADAAAPPAGFDPVAYVSASLARVPWTWEVEVVLDLPLNGSRARPGDAGRVERVRRPDASSHAGRIARLDGEPARGPRLRVRDPPARRSSRERARPRRPAGCGGRLAAGSGQDARACPNLSRRCSCFLISLPLWRLLGGRDDGIYCRPECSARPLPQHVTKYRLAAAAEAAGYRACLRCRPYRSPDALDWTGPSSSAARSSSFSAARSTVAQRRSSAPGSASRRATCAGCSRPNSA